MAAASVFCSLEVVRKPFGCCRPSVGYALRIPVQVRSVGITRPSHRYLGCKDLAPNLGQAATAAADSPADDDLSHHSGLSEPDFTSLYPVTGRHARKASGRRALDTTVWDGVQS